MIYLQKRSMLTKKLRSFKKKLNNNKNVKALLAKKQQIMVNQQHRSKIQIKESGVITGIMAAMDIMDTATSMVMDITDIIKDSHFSDIVCNKKPLFLRKDLILQDLRKCINL